MSSKPIGRDSSKMEELERDGNDEPITQPFVNKYPKLETESYQPEEPPEVKEVPPMSTPVKEPYVHTMDGPVHMTEDAATADVRVRRISDHTSPATVKVEESHSIPSVKQEPPVTPQRSSPEGFIDMLDQVPTNSGSGPGDLLIAAGNFVSATKSRCEVFSAER